MEIISPLARLFLLKPQTRFTNDLPANARKQETVNYWQEAINDVMARSATQLRLLFAVASFGRRDPESLERLRSTFTKEGIPPEFL